MIPVPNVFSVGKVAAPTITPALFPKPINKTPTPSPFPPIIAPVAFPKLNTPIVATPVIQPLQVPRTVATPIGIKPPGGGGLMKQFGGGGAVSVINTGPRPVGAPTVNIVEETAHSIMMRNMTTWNGTPGKVDILIGLKYQNGTNIIDIKRGDIIIEIIGMLRNHPFEEVIEFLTGAVNSEFILWDQKSLDEGRIKVARELVMQQTEESGVKGVGKCRYCNSNELVFATKQLRSGDEPATIFVRCVLCNKQWRQ